MNIYRDSSAPANRACAPLAQDVVVLDCVEVSQIYSTAALHVDTHSKTHNKT
jgi:hypothetical protein